MFETAAATADPIAPVIGADSVATGTDIVASSPGADTVASAPGDTTAASGGDTVASVGAPDAYADFTAPDGMAFNDTLLGEFKTTAKELNLPQDAAQRVFDLGVKLVQASQQAGADSLVEMRTGWANAAQADPEIGGAKLQSNLADMKAALDQFGSPAFREMLEGSGLGMQPEFIRAFAKIGRAISNDRIVPPDNNPGGQPASEEERAARHYPSMRK